MRLKSSEQIHKKMFFCGSSILLNLFLVRIIHSELKNDTESCSKITYEKGGRVSMVCEFLFLMSDEIRRIIY